MMLLVITSCKNTNDDIKTTKICDFTFKNKLGTWFWDKDLDIDYYLEFAKDNNVNEIYFCDYSISNKTKELLEKAYNYDIDIYLLLGEKEWILDREGLDIIINRYIEFQNNNTYKLKGIHLDIEPHQFNDFSSSRYDYLYKLVDLVYTNKKLYNDIYFSYDIPFWLDDIIEYDNKNMECYKYIIDYASSVFIMSYRDTASSMYDVSKEEIIYAKENNKTLYLAAETYSTEGDNVSYYEEGNNYMINELESLKKMLPLNFGIAIHNIKSWANLKD